MSDRRPRLGSILIRQGVISQEELEAGILYQVRTETMAGVGAVGTALPASAGPPMRLGEALVNLGICTEAEVARALAEQMSVPYIDLCAERPDRATVRLVPLHVALEQCVLPVRLEGNRLTVAAGDPGRERLRDALQAATGLPVVVVVSASASQVRELLPLYHRADLDERALNAAALETEGEADEIGTHTHDQPESLSPAERVNLLLAEAVRQGAADVFFGPTPSGVSVQYRLEGQPRQVAALSGDALPALITHLKLLFGMDLRGAARRQEGRCRVRVDGCPVKLHAATVPGPHGEGAVVRVLDAEAA